MALSNQDLSSSRLAGALSLILVLATMLSYLNSLTVPPQFDDYVAIFNNKALLSNDIWKVMTHYPSRVVLFLSFAAHFHFQFDELWAFHIVNLLIHITAGLAVFRLLYLIFDAEATSSAPPEMLPQANKALAFLGSAIFLLHPVQTQAVTYIWQRATSLSGLLYILAILFYVEMRLRRRWRFFYCLTFVTTILAMVTKENSASLPLLFVATEWLLFGRLQWAWLVRCAPLLATVVVVPVGSFAVQNLALEHVLAAPVKLTAWTYFLTQAAILPEYFQLLFDPSSLSIEHSIRSQENFFSPKVLVPLLVGLIALGWAFSLRRQYPLVLFGMLWFWITRSVEASVVPLVDPMFDHRWYVPLVGISILLTSAIRPLIGQIPKAVIYFTLCLSFVMGYQTFMRNEIWRDPISLWANVLEKYPENLRAWTNLGNAYFRTGEFAKAIDAHQHALEIAPEDPKSRFNLLSTMLELGELQSVETQLALWQVEYPEHSPYYSFLEALVAMKHSNWLRAEKALVLCLSGELEAGFRSDIEASLKVVQGLLQKQTVSPLERLK